jgi:hypothetical protein
MSTHPYEYKVLTEYITPDEKGRYPHFNHIEDQEGFTKTLEEVFNNLPGSIPEGWEVNSHNVATSRNTLIVTILLRRLKVS